MVSVLKYICKHTHTLSRGMISRGVSRADVRICRWTDRWMAAGGRRKLFVSFIGHLHHYPQSS